MTVDQIASVLVLLVVIYFLSVLGIKLANDELYSPALSWVSAIFFFLVGWFIISESKNSIGFLGFIPIITYITFKVFDNIRFNDSTKKRFKAVILSGVSTSIVYIITHSLFGFGIPEASISAIVAAGILGAIGYTA